jgi:hypothetical protein
LVLPRLLRTDSHALLWALTVLVYALLFLRLPVDAGYLVPIYPFAFLLVARVLARFSPTGAIRELRPSWREANLWHDYRTRTRWQTFAERIGDADAPPHSVVLTLGAFPDVAVINWDRYRYAIVERDLDAVSMLADNGALWDDARDVVFLAVSEPRILDRFRARGYAIYRAEPEGADWRVRLVRVD